MGQPLLHRSITIATTIQGSDNHTTEDFTRTTTETTTTTLADSESGKCTTGGCSVRNGRYRRLQREESISDRGTTA